MADSFSPSEADLVRSNGRHARARLIDELERSTGLIRSEAASVVDLGGPMCSKCQRRVPREDVAAHVAVHAGA